MGMMAVKKLIETAPCMIKENMTEADAKDARDKLLAVGATANIYPHGTWKKPTGINIQTVDAAAQTIYNLQGVRINAKFENLPGWRIYCKRKESVEEIKLSTISIIYIVASIIC